MSLLIFLVILAALLIVNHIFLSNPFRDLDVHVAFDRTSSQPGDSFYLCIRFENHGILPILSLEATMRFSGSLHPSDEKWAEEHCIQSMGQTVYHETTWIMPHQSLVIKVPLTADQRGKYVVGSLFLTIGDFLGFKSVTEAYRSTAEITIIPKRGELSKQMEAFGGFLGEQSVQRWIHEDPVIIESYSDYTGREPMRNIAWVQSAKRGNLIVKRYDHTVENKVLLVLDTEKASGEACELLFSMCRSVMEVLDQKRIGYAFATNANVTIDLQKSLYVGQGSGRTMGFLEILGRAVYGQQMSLRQLSQKLEKSSQNMQGMILLTSQNELEIQSEIQMMKQLAGNSVFVMTAQGEQV